jgi:3-deoxy-D-manno-octulosonic-acid transferase
MTPLDALYLPVALASAPWWALKKRGGWGERFGKVAAPTRNGKPRIVLHGVSVGEVAALRGVVPLLTADADVVVATTTDTGMQRAKELFGATCGVVRYPLDFSWSVGRFLERVKPDVVGLVELEVWPQFVGACAARGIATCVINGRLSERSFKGYRRIRGTIGRALSRLEFAAVQDADYAERFVALGLDPNACLLTGSMKWDAASIADEVPGGDELAKEMGIDRSRPLVVAGSTMEDEEALLRAALPAGCQLLCAPRKPEHFEEAARALAGCVRRSRAGVGTARGGLFLLDTIGELRKAYALADVVVVGRSFGTLYGSDPIEPVALGKATVIGPRHADFQSIVRSLRDAKGLLVAERGDLQGVLTRLVGAGGVAERRALGDAGRACIRRHQGASVRHAELLLSLADGRAARATEAASTLGTGSASGRVGVEVGN